MMANAPIATHVRELIFDLFFIGAVLCRGTNRGDRHSKRHERIEPFAL